MSADIAQKSVAKSNEKLVNQNYATLFLSWVPFNTNSLNGKAEISNLQWFLTFIAMFELFPVKIDISQVQN